MSAKQTLLLIDGHALIHRAYHAIPPLNTRTGQTTNAVFGFVTMLLKALNELQPTHVAVAFDPPGPTFRHQEYKEYKAHRPPPSDDLRSQFALVRRLVQAFHIPTYEVPGYEADDVLGTLARQATQAGLDTVIVTGDLDTLQLVNDHVRVYTTKGHFSDTITYDAQAVRARYGLEPRQLADYRGLKGDPSDNIPGIKGIGDKTATHLLQQFGSVAGIYEHLEQVPPAVREKLAAQKEQASRSARLATIVTDVPVTLDLDACRVTQYDREAVLELFRELEFRSLVDRLPGAVPPSQREGAGGRESLPTQMSLFGDETPIEAGRAGAAFSLAPTRTDAAAKTTVILTEESLLALAHRLAASDSFCVDVETTSPNAMTADLVGVALALSPEETYYVPIGHPTPPVQLSLDVVQRHLGPVLADPSIGKVAHNAKYDVTVLTRHGLPVAGVAYDTMIAAYLLCEKGLGLKDLAFTRLGVEMTPITDLIGKGKGQITMAQVPVESVAPYAGADVEMTLRLQAFFTPRLHEEGLWDLFHDVEMPLVHVLTVMEMNGVLLDTDRLAAFSRELGAQIAELEDRIYAAAGAPFNVNSTQQLGQVLFEQLKLPGGKRTKTGYSTAADVLEGLRDRHEIVQYLLDYRQLTKLKSTYVDALPALVNPQTGRVHTSFNQTVAATGRLSSSDPNLQNIPARTELGRQVRAAFIAPPGRVLLSADYSQVELRILAHISGDEALRAAFARGEDIHAATAAALFDVPLDQITKEHRRMAKAINFGIIYGMSEYGLAQRIHVTPEEAAQYIAEYLGEYPRVKEYLDRTIRQAREQGYVATLLGRRRYTPELKSSNKALQSAGERAAVNHPIQGTAADIIKVAMVRLQREIEARGLRSLLTLQVHDELVLEVPTEELDEMTALVVNVMEGAFEMIPPLKVDVSVGENWEEMEPVAGRELIRQAMPDPGNASRGVGLVARPDQAKIVPISYSGIADHA